MLPISTTSLTITRAVTADPDEEDVDSEEDYAVANITIQTIAVLRGHINAGGGVRQFGAGGERERVVFKFTTEQFNGTIYGDDSVTDDDGQVYTVIWARARKALGLSFIEGEVYQQTGEV